MSNPPIYIINLKRTPERKLHIQRQLDALNLRYQFVDAIDKYDLHSQAYREAIAHQLDIDKHQIDSLCKSMKEGQAACTLSHIKVYNLMIKNNIPLACILEDDCRLLPTFPEILVDTQVFLRDVIMFAHQSVLVRGNPNKNLLIKLIMFSYQSALVRARLVDFSHYSDKRRFFYRLLRVMLYKEYYPKLSLYIVYATFLFVIRYTFLRCWRLRRCHGYIQYCACSIGGMPSPNKAPRHRFISNHCIVEPLPNPSNTTSAMGYMLTRSAAIKWKCATMSMRRTIDFIQGNLYCEGDLDLLIISPPCIIASAKYLRYTARDG